MPPRYRGRGSAHWHWNNQLESRYSPSHHWPARARPRRFNNHNNLYRGNNSNSTTHYYNRNYNYSINNVSSNNYYQNNNNYHQNNNNNYHHNNSNVNYSYHNNNNPNRGRNQGNWGHHDQRQQHEGFIMNDMIIHVEEDSDTTSNEAESEVNSESNSDTEDELPNNINDTDIANNDVNQNINNNDNNISNINRLNNDDNHPSNNNANINTTNDEMAMDVGNDTNNNTINVDNTGNNNNNDNNVNTNNNDILMNSQQQQPLPSSAPAQQHHFTNLLTTSTPIRNNNTINNNNNEQQQQRLNNDNIIFIDNVSQLANNTSNSNNNNNNNDNNAISVQAADASFNDFKTPVKSNNTNNNNRKRTGSDEKKKESSDESFEDNEVVGFMCRHCREGGNQRLNEDPSTLEDMGFERCCPICLEPWTTSGLHRLVSLKCGHLFGQSCIEKWLPQSSKGKCPNCNAKAYNKDIRVIFAKRLKALDTSERDRLISELDRERKDKQAIEMTNARNRLQMQHALEECQKLREENEKLKTTVQMNQVQIMMMMSNRSQQQSSSSSQVTATSSSLSSSSSSQMHPSVSTSSSPASRCCFVFERTVKCDPGSCRVISYHGPTSTLYISQLSPNPLFPGFGIKKLRTLDLKTHEYVPIHSKLIRDLAFNHNGSSSSSNQLLLTASMDKTLKITNVSSNQVVQSYECLSPVWSCCWHTDSPNYFFAGLQNGNVFMYDTRFNNTHVSSLTSTENSKSVVSLHYLARLVGNQYRPGGLIVGQLDNSIFFECKDSNKFNPHYLPFEGLLSSLSIESTTSHILASFRPNSTYQQCRHQLYNLTFNKSTQQQQQQQNTLQCNNIQTFYGGPIQKRLIRSRLMSHPDFGLEKLLICAGNEANKSVDIWNASNGLRHQAIPTISTTTSATTAAAAAGGGGCDDVLDICPVTDEATGRPYMLAVLNDKEVNVYKWG